MTGDRKDVEHQRNYLEALLKTVQKGIDAGQSLADLKKTKTLSGFADHESRGTFLTLGKCIDTAYVELTAEKKKKSSTTKRKD